MDLTFNIFVQVEYSHEQKDSRFSVVFVGFGFLYRYDPENENEPLFGFLPLQGLLCKVCKIQQNGKTKIVVIALWRD